MLTLRQRRVHKEPSNGEGNRNQEGGAENVLEGAWCEKRRKERASQKEKTLLDGGEDSSTKNKGGISIGVRGEDIMGLKRSS